MTTFMKCSPNKNRLPNEPCYLKLDDFNLNSTLVHAEPLPAALPAVVHAEPLPAALSFFPAPADLPAAGPPARDDDEETCSACIIAAYFQIDSCSHFHSFFTPRRIREFMDSFRGWVIDLSC